MGYFKIKNITNSLPKRHIKKDTMLEVEFSSGFKKESFRLNIGAEAYIEARNLPINIHKLRMKKLISVVEISKNTFYKKQKPATTKKPIPNAKVEEKKTTKKPIPKAVVKEVKKRNYKKKEESTVISKSEAE